MSRDALPQSTGADVEATAESDQPTERAAESAETAELGQLMVTPAQLVTAGWTADGLPLPEGSRPRGVPRW